MWEPQSEAAVIESVKRAKLMVHENREQEYRLAVDYLEGRQQADVEGELAVRFPSSQEGDAGQRIYAITIPLTERYVNEQASAYNKPVSRVLVDETGAETDETRAATLVYQRELDAAQYDEIMHANERLTVLLGSSITWHQYKRGKLRVVTAYPHEIYPVCPPNGQWMDPSDPDDYQGFVLESMWATEDIGFAQKRTFAYLSRHDLIYFTGGDPHRPKEILGQYENPYRWPQVPVGAELAQEPGLVDSPILPLVFWQRRKNNKGLICDADPEIVYANRELNVQWSALMDTIRFQSFDTPWLKTLDPKTAKARIRHGARFPVLLDQASQEDFGYASTSHPYGALVDTLMNFTKLYSTLKRMSPNDVAIDGQIPTSGFAKLIDSLPKIEAREERIKRLKATEEQRAWPINAAILMWAGKLPESVKRMRLRVKFADVEFPQTPSEESQRLQFELDHNLTTPAKILAHRSGISEAEAQEIVAANADTNGKKIATEPEPTQSLLGRFIGKTR